MASGEVDGSGLRSGENRRGDGIGEGMRVESSGEEGIGKENRRGSE